MLYLNAVRRYAEAHADWTGLAQTPIPGLTTVRATEPSGLLHAISRLLVCLVLQGSKHVTRKPGLYVWHQHPEDGTAPIRPEPAKTQTKPHSIKRAGGCRVRGCGCSGREWPEPSPGRSGVASRWH
ncbi:MAG: AraC family transcriptional regulator N-terminal domain-containing protein [Gemmatimonadaceae bacterium]|nr:AraC family transcriptional regulator N-terminal domain-containing protein [Gloeobacterales cyanobacterium ES-bin-141]